jgi:hypothetical protein
LQSLIPGAGRGAFLDGNATAGTLVAFMPGDVWPKEHLLTKNSDVMEHFGHDPDCHISMRFDDFVVDSRQSPVTVLSEQGSLNPFAVAHMVNHPACEQLPNCQSCQLNFTESMKLKGLVRFIPNQYARTPSWQSSVFDSEPVAMHGLCLVSKKDLHNEELLYDYRLQSETTPDWYHVVRYGNTLDEDQVVFFRDDWKKNN